MTDTLEVSTLYSAFILMSINFYFPKRENPENTDQERETAVVLVFPFTQLLILYLGGYVRRCISSLMAGFHQKELNSSLWQLRKAPAGSHPS